MLIASTQWTVESFRRIEEQKIPYVLLDRQFAGFESNFVGVDDMAVGVLATKHLIEQGCKRIAHVRGPEISTANGRLEGYRQALAAHQMAPLPGHVVSIGPSGDHVGDKAGYAATVKLLAGKNRPDGIFCFNDPVALGTMRAILDAGLRSGRHRGGGLREPVVLGFSSRTAFVGRSKQPDDWEDCSGTRAETCPGQGSSTSQKHIGRATACGACFKLSHQSEGGAGPREARLIAAR
jgi:hypothetical protein